MSYESIHAGNQPLKQMGVDIAESKHLLDEISQVIAEMVRMRYRDTPEFQRMLHSYQQLSRLIARGSKLQLSDKQQDTAKRQVSEAHDFSGITALKSTLGPFGQPRVLSTGNEVINLQKFLAASGIDVGVTGQYDFKTSMAVRQFQTRFHMNVTGIVGAETRKVINDMLQHQDGIHSDVEKVAVS